MLTVPQLQPQPGDPAPFIVCREVDPPDEEFPTGLAVFRCGKCGWWENVEFNPLTADPVIVRRVAIGRHKAAGRCP